MNTNRMVAAFYAVVLVTALVGSTMAAAGWLHVYWLAAAVPVAAVELGGVVLSMFAEDRRKLGENAIVARLLSAAVALTAAAVNFFGHPHIGQAAFFGTMSLLGYSVYLLISAAKRRDALRKAGKLEDTAPSYGAWQWLRHPGLTRRARTLAITEKLGPIDSLAAAREQIRTERRESALAASVRKLIAASAGKRMAAIAVDTYDMGEIARRLANHADYDGLAGLLAAELTAEKLAGFSGPDGADDRPVDDLDALVDVVAPDLFGDDELVIVETPPEPPSPQVVPRIRVGKLGRISERASRRLAAKKSAPVPVAPAPVKAPRTTEKAPRKAAPRTTTGRPSAAEKVLKAAKVLPAGAGVAEIAKKAGVTPETAKKHLAALNGNEVHA